MFRKGFCLIKLNKLEEALVQKLKIQTEKENLNSSLKESNMKLTKAQEEINGLIVEKKEQIEKMDEAIEDEDDELALQNAASIASMVLTTESLVADIKEDTPAAPAMPAGGMY